MSYGVTPEGFVPKTIDVLLAELEDSWRATFGASVNLSPQSRNGQALGIFSERLSELWELGEAVYNAFNPDAAAGAALDNVAALTGTTRDPATRSTVTLTATGDDSTILPAGRQVSVQGTGVKFETLAGATLEALAARANSTIYALDARRTHGGNAYQVITAGTSAGSGGPTGTGSDITDGTVHWRFLGEGMAAADIEAQSVDTGVKVANSGTLSVIETPVSGWKGAINVLDAVLGHDIETDLSLKQKREDELRATGNSALEPIRADLLQVAGVTAVTVFENPTNATDADGLPPHSVEALVQGGASADIFAAIFESKAAGIQAFGTTSGEVVDSQGITHEVAFSRPVDKLIWVTLAVVKDPLLYPTDGDEQIKQAIVAFGDAQATGKNVVASSLSAQAFRISGVLDVSSVLISYSPTTVPVASTTIAVSLRELAVFDTSRISVSSSDGVP